MITAKHSVCLLLIGLLLMPVSRGMSQTHIGVSLSPAITYARVDAANDSLQLRGDGMALRPAVALRVDLPIGARYFIGTGLRYFSRPLNMQRSLNGQRFKDEQYKIQHLQMPLALKMLTNEFSLDKRFYAQIGSTFDVKIHEEAAFDGETSIEQFKRLGITLLLGAGVEFRLGPGTYAQIGLSYHRGLTNLVGSSGFSPAPQVKNDSFCVDLFLYF